MKPFALVALLVFGFPGMLPAQTPAPPRPATLDDLLAEVRALRADIQKMQDASVRAQLLVARLQVQEQRIAGIARDLAETDKQIRELEAARNPMAVEMLKGLSEQPMKPGEPDFLAGLRAHLERIEHGDPVLTERQASLAKLLAEEQARWTAFNAQLEALERDLPVVKRK
jgi:chromosome segregation ATPase